MVDVRDISEAVNCLLQADAARIPLADGSVDMIFTDPPYVKDLVHTYQYVAREENVGNKLDKWVAGRARTNGGASVADLPLFAEAG